ncbi:MAG: PQQ-dependent sugar dehydrogenase [Pseudomonadota bacterium]
MPVNRHRSAPIATPSWRPGRRLLAACLLCLAAGAQGATDYRIVTFTDGLSIPWCLAFLPDGRMLVTERAGRLRFVAPDGTLGAPLEGVPEPYVRSQGGLFDVLPAQDFQTTGTVYLSYAGGTPEANNTRVVRAQLTDEGLVDAAQVFAVSPTKDTPAHYGGRLAWHGEHLLLTTGDGFDYREAAQDPASQLGKTLRFAVDGSVPADNPFASATDGTDPYVFTSGHRSPQGLVVTPDGEVFQHEHGPQGGDELNRLVAGQNYGWPLVGYGRDYSGALISPFERLPAYAEPEVHWTPSIAASGLAFYAGDRFPQWRGDLFVGALIEQSVRRVDLAAGRVVGEEILFTEIGERIRDVRTGPDGYLYVLTDTELTETSSGRILRIEPAAVSAPANQTTGR